ncbi:DUF6152 family protein [Azotobacter salinestris]|uniref:DUF6152 family protein n=1 Tax=Azotobacter salinestris TaxID=69964 RepID=UPI0032DED770
MPRKIASLLFGFALSLVATATLAHHGWSSYDASQTLVIEAPLKQVQYRSPHVEAKIDYQGREWNVVLAPVSRLEARGLPEADLSKGKVVKLVGYPRKDGTPEIRAERITLDGRTVELR